MLQILRVEGYTPIRVEGRFGPQGFSFTANGQTWQIHLTDVDGRRQRAAAFASGELDTTCVMPLATVRGILERQYEAYRLAEQGSKCQA